MGRIKVKINKDELIKVITELESTQTFGNRGLLATAISGTDWGKLNKVTPSVALLRITEFKLEPKTPKGKRGRQAGVKMDDEQKRVMQDGRKNKKYDEIWVKELTKSVPTVDSRGNNTDRFTKVLQKAIDGSLKSAIKLKCLDCTSYQTNEIKFCQCISCPLYGVRPYK